MALHDLPKVKMRVRFPYLAPENFKINFVRRFLSTNFLFLIVFLTGAGVLVIEVAATRVFSPYFGNTIFTISSILGVVLGALSLGYYFGGWFADKYPKFSLFFLLIFLAGIFATLIQCFSVILLPSLAKNYDLKIGPLLASICLLFLPNFFLGMISPFAIKLKTLQLSKVGRVSGKIFFWSTLGSIFGSFLTGFFLVPHFGISKIIIFSGSFLLILGFSGFLFTFKRENFNLDKKIIFLFIFGFFAFLLSFFTFFLPKPSSILFQKEGLYNQITIGDFLFDDREIRVLRFDHYTLESGIFLDSKELFFDYTKYYALYKILTPQAKKALFLGGGAYTTPRQLLLEKNNLEIIDVVEIEPSLFELAKKYFYLPNDPRLKNHIEDGRVFLRKTSKKYDFIFTDVFRSFFNIPVHFATKEFFELAKSGLTQEGFFLMNIIGKLEGKGSEFLLSEIKTFSLVFPKVYLFAVESPQKKEIQNFILLGFKDKKKEIEFDSPFFKENSNPIIANLAQKRVSLEKLDFSKALILRDDFAPVDYLMAKLY